MDSSAATCQGPGQPAFGRAAPPLQHEILGVLIQDATALANLAVESLAPFGRVSFLVPQVEELRDLVNPEILFIDHRFLEGTDLVLVIGSFGASAVLIYGAIRSPLAQPRNLLGGHIISAFIGVFTYKLLYPHIWLAAALGVATSIAVMHATRTLHPPGGATALIPVIGGQKIHDLGYLYAIIPVGTGALIMLIVALFINNLSRTRRYPEFWF